MMKAKEKVGVIKQVKGYEKLRKLNFLNYIGLLILSTLLLSVSGQTFLNINQLKKEEATYKIWNKSKNIYKVAYNDNLEPGETKKQNKIDQNMVKLYNELIASNKGFLIDTYNFILLSKNPYRFEFEDNIHKKEDIYGMDGNSITVSSNYFKFNSISPKQAIKKISKDKNTLNILVPQQLRSKEKIIYQKMLDDFYDQKVGWKNTINKEIGKKAIHFHKSDLRVNIIYINNDQKYFTLSNTHGVPDNNYQIVDPIVVILNPTIADTLISSLMTTSLYIKDMSNSEAFTHLQPLLAKTHTQKNIVFVDSVFNLYGDKVSFIKSSLKIYTVIIVSSALLVFILLAVQIYIYYKVNFKKIQVQLLLGHSIFKINHFLLIFLLVANLFLIIGTYLVFNQLLLILLGTFLTILEISLVLAYTYYLSNQSLSDLKKGGN